MVCFALSSPILRIVLIRGLSSFTNGSLLFGESDPLQLRLPQAESGDIAMQRDDLSASLLEIIRPNSSGKYAAVCGEHGTGKTTAVQTVVRGLSDLKGVVYFLVKDAASTEVTFRCVSLLVCRAPLALSVLTKLDKLQSPVIMSSQQAACSIHGSC